MRTIIHSGAIDYLVKPFPRSGSRQAKNLLLPRQGSRESEHDQSSVDEVCASGQRWLPERLPHERLSRVRDVLEAAGGDLTAADIATRKGSLELPARRVPGIPRGQWRGECRGGQLGLGDAAQGVPVDGISPIATTRRRGH